MDFLTERSDVDPSVPTLMYMPLLVKYLEVDRRYRGRGIEVQIRRYRWGSVIEDVLRPRNHFLDFSLLRSSRSSRLASDAGSAMRRPGRVVYLPGGCACRGEVDLVEHRSLCIAFDDQFVRDALMQERELEFCACLDIGDPGVHTLLMNMHDELLDPGFASDVYLRSSLTSLVVHLSRLNPKPLEPSAIALRRDPKRISRAREFIHANLNREIDVGSLGRTLGVSPRHLARTFKASTGTTLGEYVAHRRIDRARALLQNPEMRIKEISAECGFASSAYFASAFRKATGHTPRSFRKTLRLQLPIRCVKFEAKSDPASLTYEALQAMKTSQ
jgi:AraC family transcriptional regulator